MNIELANRLPLPEILGKIGFEPVAKGHNRYRYYSPLRQEHTPSFYVHVQKNLWYDFGEGAGGRVVSFVQAYLKSHKENHTVFDALRWLHNMAGYVPVIPPEYISKNVEDAPALIVRDSSSIRHLALIQYLQSRGISIPVAKQHLKELRVVNTSSKKTFFALGLENEGGGFELRNKYFKASIRPKTITFIRGKIPKPEGVNIFEGFMDYLSVITQQRGQKFNDDTIILNSLSCLKDASAYIKNYGYHVAYTWLDNDAAGDMATRAFAEFFQTEPHLRHQAMNSAYALHKDVNAAHMAALGL